MIVANTVQTAVDGPFIKGEYGFAGVEYVLNILNYVFGGVFTLEFLLKVFAPAARVRRRPPQPLRRLRCSCSPSRPRSSAPA